MKDIDFFLLGQQKAKNIFYEYNSLKEKIELGYGKEASKSYDEGIFDVLNKCLTEKKINIKKHK